MVNNSRLYTFYRAPTPALPLVSTVMDLTVHGSRHRYSRLKIDAEKKNQYHVVFQSGEVIKFVNTSNRYRVSLFSKQIQQNVRFDVIIACCEDIYGSYSIKKTNKQPNKTPPPPPPKKKPKKQNKPKQKQNTTNWPTSFGSLRPVFSLMLSNKIVLSYKHI